MILIILLFFARSDLQPGVPFPSDMHSIARGPKLFLFRSPRTRRENQQHHELTGRRFGTWEGLGLVFSKVRSAFSFVKLFVL